MNENYAGQREKRLRQAYEYIEAADWGEREAAVRLALKALLVMRGALNQKVIDRMGPKIYSTLAKYVRASNAETLSALIDDVLDNVSPQFIPHPALGSPVEDIYATDAASDALALLKDETIPLVIMLKKIYQQFIESEEEDSDEEA